MPQFEQLSRFPFVKNHLIHASTLETAHATVDVYTDSHTKAPTIRIPDFSGQNIYFTQIPLEKVRICAYEISIGARLATARDETRQVLSQLDPSEYGKIRQLEAESKVIAGKESVCWYFDSLLWRASYSKDSGYKATTYRSPFIDRSYTNGSSEFFTEGNRMLLRTRTGDTRSVDVFPSLILWVRHPLSLQSHLAAYWQNHISASEGKWNISSELTQNLRHKVIDPTINLRWSPNPKPITKSRPLLPIPQMA
jgi:hypothetical protein